MRQILVLCVYIALSAIVVLLVLCFSVPAAMICAGVEHAWVLIKEWWEMINEHGSDVLGGPDHE